MAGEVVAVGEDVAGWAVGYGVLTHGNMFRPHGGLAEFTVQDARTLVAHPEGIDPATAASTPCAGWTAWRALHDRLRLSADDTLLVAGGSGGVGGFALQIARDARLRTVIATTSPATPTTPRAWARRTSSTTRPRTSWPGSTRSRVAPA